MATPSMVKPDQAGYNIFTPQYAAALGQSTGNQGADVLRHLALINAAARENGQYGLAVDRANQATLQAQKADNTAEHDRAVINNFATNATAGSIAPMVAYASGADYGAIAPRLDQIDTLRADKTAAEALQARMAGVKSAADAGYGLDPKTVGTMVGGPLAEEAPTITPNYFTPNAAADMKRADASVKSADAAMVAAHKAPADQQGTWEIQYDPQGNVISLVQRGKGGMPSAGPAPGLDPTLKDIYEIVDGKVVLRKR